MAIETGSIVQNGLTSQEARQRLQELGPNEPSPVHRSTAWAQLARLFTSPLIAILLVAACLSAVVGEWVNATIILSMVLLGVGLVFIQTYHSQHAVERLRKSVASTASVLRDGTWSEVPNTDVVPDDLIRISAGDLVPADALLITSEHLQVQESALTGESFPIEKRATAGQNPCETNTVYLGTSVVCGSATALITATGQSTAFGEIAARLAARPPESEFDRGTRQFGLFIMRTVLFLVLFVFMINATLKRNAFESLLFAIALAVGLTPEFLPMITSVTLAQGAIHMARKKVIVKNLATMQNFGSIDVLCSDKTGTLTSGKLSLHQHFDAFGSASEQAFRYIYLNSALQTGITNPIDTSLQQLAVRNPLDLAILNHDHPDVRRYRKIAEIPFEFERRLHSVVVEAGQDRLMITKGAPESVLARSVAYDADGVPRPFDAETRSHSEKTYQNLSAAGFRVLGVAYRRLPIQDTYDAGEEKDLTLAGFVTFIDPPLEEAAAAVKSLHRDHVRMKILTGDNALVTKFICDQVGLKVGTVITGEELDRMNDSALAHIVEKTTVFARVSPMQKNRIILALKSRKHTVGYLGDGINDAPSLHTADVGISVCTAVDVAKDAASIILMENSLKVLHDGIIEGRKAFGNVMKYLLMGTSSNFGNMFSMAAASIFLPFLPMLPTQILLNNFLYDLAQVTIPTDNVDPSFIRKPHHWDIGLIRNFMIFIGPISSVYDFLTFYVLLAVFHSGEALFHTGWFVESLATQTLVLFVIRTAGNPFRSRPSLPLVLTTVLVVLVGTLIPFTPLASPLGFVPLPALYFAFLAAATITYLAFVELVKRRLLRR